MFSKIQTLKLKTYDYMGYESKTLSQILLNASQMNDKESTCLLLLVYFLFKTRITPNEILCEYLGSIDDVDGLVLRKRKIESCLLNLILSECNLTPKTFDYNEFRSKVTKILVKSSGNTYNEYDTDLVKIINIVLKEIIEMNLESNRIEICFEYAKKEISFYNMFIMYNYFFVEVPLDLPKQIIRNELKTLLRDFGDFNEEIEDKIYSYIKKMTEKYNFSIMQVKSRLLYLESQKNQTTDSNNANESGIDGERLNSNLIYGQLSLKSNDVFPKTQFCNAGLTDNMEEVSKSLLKTNVNTILPDSIIDMSFNSLDKKTDLILKVDDENNHELRTNQKLEVDIFKDNLESHILNKKNCFLNANESLNTDKNIQIAIKSQKNEMEFNLRTAFDCDKETPNVSSDITAKKLGEKCIPFDSSQNFSDIETYEDEIGSKNNIQEEPTNNAGLHQFDIIGLSSFPEVEQCLFKPKEMKQVEYNSSQSESVNQDDIFNYNSEQRKLSFLDYKTQGKIECEDNINLSVDSSNDSKSKKEKSLITTIWDFFTFYLPSFTTSKFYENQNNEERKLMVKEKKNEELRRNLENIILANKDDADEESSTVWHETIDWITPNENDEKQFYDGSESLDAFEINRGRFLLDENETFSDISNLNMLEESILRNNDAINKISEINYSDEQNQNMVGSLYIGFIWIVVVSII